MTDFQTDEFEQLSALAAQAQNGDAQAYETLLRKLYPFIAKVVRSKLGAVVDVDDVTQECLLGVHKSLPTYLPGRSLKPWLRAIIRYKLADHFRALARKKEQMFVEDEHGVTNGRSEANRKEEAAGKDAVDVRALVQTLPEPLRQAVVLTKLQGLSSAEAARREGVSDAALRKRVSRAYRMLARAAQQELETERGER